MRAIMLNQSKITFSLKKQKTANFDVKENSDTDVLVEQEKNKISLTLPEELYPEYGQLTDNELCP